MFAGYGIGADAKSTRLLHEAVLTTIRVTNVFAVNRVGQDLAEGGFASPSRVLSIFSFLEDRVAAGLDGKNRHGRIQ